MSNVASPIRIINTDFRAGELSPDMAMRIDTKVYPSGARSLLNCRIRNTGAVTRRPGTTYLANLAARSRLLAFEYDEDEKYILAFQNNALRIYQSNGTLLTSFTGTSNCPWTTTTMFELTTAQKGDVMFICHRSFRPKVLRRTGLTTFTLVDFSFKTSPNNARIYQPYLKYEAASVTLEPSTTNAGTGVTVKASSAIFSSSWVGDVIRIYGIELTITAFTSTTQVTATAKKDLKTRLDNNPFLYKDGSRTIEVTHVDHGLTTGDDVVISGATDVYSIVRGNINGTRTITVVDEDRYTFTAGGTTNASESADTGGAAVEIATTAPTRNWDEQVFSNRRGWPGAVCFHEDRLWFGGSQNVPDGLWSSQTGDYYNFEVGKGLDNESIQVSIGASRISSIRHLLSNRVLQIFAEGAEFVAKQSDGVGLTPSSISVRPQTSYGCSYIAPKSFDGATLFQQANGKTIREFLYDFNQDGFQASDMTTVSPHLIKNPIDFDVFYGSTDRAEQYSFFINNDGTMAIFHSIRSEGLAAWTPWQTRSGDVFDSVVVLSTQVFLSVLRNGTYRFEKLEVDSDVFVDCAKHMTSGSATTTWALGSVYANQQVAVVSNDWYLGTFTANASGTITISNAVTSITAGYNYDWQVIPNPPDKELVSGPLTGEKRRIVSVTAHVYETNHLLVDGRNVVGYSIGDDLSVPPPAQSKKIKRYLSGYDRDPVVVLSQNAPLPVTVLGLVMEVSF